jgi:hypothetical protein
MSPESARAEQEDLPLELELQTLCNRLTAARDCASLQRALDEITAYLTVQREREKVHAVLALDHDEAKQEVAHGP